MKKVCFLVFILYSSLIYLHSEVFRFKYLEGEKYRIITEVDENVYINGALSHRANILNKIAVDTLKVKESSGLLSCTFQTSERAYGVHASFALTENYQSLFWRDGIGVYDIGPMYFMPVVRNVPTFPDQDIQPGYSWSAQGEEVHDLRRSYKIDKAFHFPIQVHYTYLRTEEKEGRQLDVIKVHYTVFYRVKNINSYSNLVPVKITGVSDQIFYWDNRSGKPHSYEEEFDFIFHLKDGQTVEYEGWAKGTLIESPKMNKERIADEIQKVLEEKGVEDATVQADDRGVTVTLQNIQFQPNSAFLLQSEKDKLKTIGEILKAYPERDILITGHTAKVSGYTYEDFQSLSENRASSVADFLIFLDAVGEKQVMTSGAGCSKPLASNETEDGRRLNRRVEITILEN